MKKWLNFWSKGVTGKRTRWAVLGLWIAIIALISVIWPQVNSQTTDTNQLLPDDAMSVEASQIMDEQFSNDAGKPLLLVWYRESGLTTEDFEAVQSLYKKLKESPITEQKFIPPFGEAPPQALEGSASEDQAALSTPVFFDEGANEEELQKGLDTIEQYITDITGEQLTEKDLGASGLHVRFSGPVGIQLDAGALFGNADITLLIATVILVLVLLIVLYRSPILAVVPLVAVGFAYGVINPLLGFMAKWGWIVVDAQTTSIMTVLLFGAGTDYCLFLISRYRDELRHVEDKYTALERALKHSGGAIMMSSLTTMLGLLTLGLALYASYNRFAVPFSLAIFIMGITAVTALPAILSLLGRIAFIPFIPRTEKMIQALEKKKRKKLRRPKERTRFSSWLGKLVTEKPWRIIISLVLIFGAFAAVIPKMQFTYGLLDSFPENMPSREGFEIIQEHYPPGEAAPVNVIVNTKGKDVPLAEAFSDMNHIEKVSDPHIGSENSDYMQVEATLNIDPYSDKAIKQIPEIVMTTENALKAAGINQVEDVVWVGGETATLYETEEITSRDQDIIIPIVLLIIGALLFVYLRSLVATLYLLATVVLSYGSALGIGWLVLHYIFGVSAIQGLIPLYSFVFLVALGVDYNIFLVSNIWNKAKRFPITQAIDEGVGETGSVISSAGLILAGTFSVLAVLPLQVLVHFGTITAIGILIDTFIVRPLLVPSITTVFGRYAFWPGKLWRQTSRNKD
ncbi:putative membrane protein [Lentibacillus sp. JNUCC-1]|uniref:MMPL family transporter n=1 Tax=Lentibacillus sp. JNUCC-1 TaxID=2654513 RepID=UPI0012E7318F|nr:MMPL family transporter [Lentibacillus sp. JNUCC-1]MUV36623.1 putative membrane protein [Lentibacillus sp. JNUCC-1]